MISLNQSQIRTGLGKQEKEPKVVSVLKEEKQTFGLLLGKSASSEQAHSHLLTTLALETSDGDFRQGSKAIFRNYIVKVDCTEEIPNERGDWTSDGMATVRSVPPKSTWKES